MLICVRAFFQKSQLLKSVEEMAAQNAVMVDEMKKKEKLSVQEKILLSGVSRR